MVLFSWPEHERGDCAALSSLSGPDGSLSVFTTLVEPSTHTMRCPEAFHFYFTEKGESRKS